MSEFTLDGKTDEKDGKFACIIDLNTPDGRHTRIESEYSYTEEEAVFALKTKLEEILEEFKKDGVEIKNWAEGVVQ